MSNELYHYGVLGMKWGIRRNSSAGRSSRVGAKLKKKYDQKREKKTEELQKDTDHYGVGGVAVGRYAGYKAKHHIRGHLANAYIANSGSKHRIATGVDYARRASISYLSMRDNAEKINAVADVGKAAIYSSKKKRET